MQEPFFILDSDSEEAQAQILAGREHRRLLDTTERTLPEGPKLSQVPTRSFEDLARQDFALKPSDEDDIYDPRTSPEAFAVVAREQFDELWKKLRAEEDEQASI